MPRFNSHLTAEMEEGCSKEAILTDAKREENTEALKTMFPGIYFEFTHLKEKPVETEYQFWNAPKSGETYAVEVDSGGEVVGICGPLYYGEVKAEMLPLYDYRPAPDGFDGTEWTYDERSEA